MSSLGNKQIMAANIRRCLALTGKTQKEICKDLGFKEMTFSDWVNAKTYPRIDKIEKMANYFHIQKADLVEEYRATPARKPWEGLKNIVPPEDLEVRKVPLLGTIAAGKPIFSDEHIEAMIPCHDSRIDFALQIQGDSMIDAEYYDGDIVFIHSQPMVDNGQIAAVRVDDSATLKRFYKENDSVTLMSANPLYPPMHFDASNCDEIAIIGIPVARYTEHTK